MRFVDANVFIYALVKSPKKDYEISKRILKRIENGEETATSLAVLQEVVDWLEYNKRKKRSEASQPSTRTNHEQTQHHMG
jgi:predicted nucleic acid-binding protein